jgi:hypothetical protein
MAQLINQQFGVLSQQYTQNRQENWIHKVTMLNLIITASIGSYTYNHGASELLISQEQLFQYLD